MQREGTDVREKKRQKVKKKLLNNLGLKLVSVFLAVVIWFAVVMISNPQDSVTFSNIAVKLTNTKLLDAGDKIYEVVNNTDRIRVTVEAPRNVIDQLRASDIIAEADVSRLTEVNTIAINCSVINANVEVRNITSSPDVVQLNVEDRASKWVKVNLNTVGKVAEGYVVYSKSGDQTRMEISGPESVIEQISHAGLEMDVTGATDNVSGNVEIRFYDMDGNVIDSTNITKNAEFMHMEVEVLAMKEVPVELNVTGTPAEGYLVTGLPECDPPTVVLAGTESALAEINRISVPIDISDENADVERSISLRSALENGIHFAQSSFNGKVTAVVHIEPSVERTLVIPGRNVTVQNLPEGYELEFQGGQQQAYRLRISGLSVNTAAVEQAAVQGVVDIAAWMEEQDMTELTEGIYEIPVDFELPENVKIENELTARVMIKQVDEEDEE